jgi:peptide deformylase
MTAQPIHLYGDPVLRAQGDVVREFGPALRAIGDGMLASMRAARGIGLAAPQVGLSLQLFVIDVKDKENPLILNGKVVDPETVMPMLFANATVTIPAGEKEIYTEGCLSFPGITGDVERVEKTIVQFRDVSGAPHTLECTGILARCVQHEHDHCQGVLFIDRMTRAHQLLVSSKIKKLKKKTLSELKKAKTKS